MWSDKETEQDCLGFDANVEVLAQCCTHETLSPLTLGIFGIWGSGKTSLMRMLKKQVEAQENTRFLTLWFNAWRYEGRDEAQSALIHAILGRISDERTLGQEAKDLMKRMIDGASVMKLASVITKSALTMTPDFEGFLESFGSESKKLSETMETFENDFQALLDQVELDVIIVFIDDLDRCSSHKVVETFETIKLFLNTPKCTFVIGADPNRIEEAVGEIYDVRGQSRRDYLEKIIHLPFQIPPQGLRDIQCYVGFLVLQRHLDESLWQELLKQRVTLHASQLAVLDEFKAWLSTNRDRMGGKFEEAVRDLERLLTQSSTIARGLRGNPRQIKRFMNILMLREQLATANQLKVDHAIIVKLAVLEYTWKETFEALVESVDPSTGRSELLQALIESDVETLGKIDDSPLLVSAGRTPGLIIFLKSDPELPADLDLRPYFFLAQTSFGSTPQPGLATLDQVVTDLVEKIASPDRLRSRSAALQAAQHEESLAEDVLRRLITELAAKEELTTRTHIVVGMDEICRKTPKLYPLALDALRNLKGQVPDALAIAATTLLNNAAITVNVDSNLKERFSQSELAQALGSLSSGKGSRKSR